jgi:hypothetical protein
VTTGSIWKLRGSKPHSSNNSGFVYDTNIHALAGIWAYTIQRPYTPWLLFGYTQHAVHNTLMYSLTNNFRISGRNYIFVTYHGAPSPYRWHCRACLQLEQWRGLPARILHSQNAYVELRSTNLADRQLCLSFMHSVILARFPLSFYLQSHKT